MIEALEQKAPGQARGQRFRSRLNLRAFLLLSSIAGVLAGLQLYRPAINPQNAGALRRVAGAEAPYEALEIAWSPDLAHIALRAKDRPAEIRNAPSFAAVETLKGPNKTDLFGQIAIGPGGRLVALESAKPQKKQWATVNTADPLTTLLLLDRVTGEARTLAADLSCSGTFPAFSPDGSLLVAGGARYKLYVWDVASGTIKHRLGVTDPSQARSAFSPDGRFLAVIDHDYGRVLVLSAETGEKIYEFPATEHLQIAFNPASSAMASLTPDGKLDIRKLDDGTLIASARIVDSTYSSIDWSRDGAVLATAGGSGLITFWNARDLSWIDGFQVPYPISSMKFGPDGQGLYTIGISNGQTILETHGASWGPSSWLGRSRR